MDEEKIKSLATLLNRILNDQQVQFDITNTNHASIYLDIFLKAAKENNGDPVPYDAFGEQLWVQLAKDRPRYEKTVNDFMTVWTAWVDLFKHLKKSGDLIPHE